MSKRLTGSILVLVLGSTLACSDDPVSQNGKATTILPSAPNFSPGGGLGGPNDRGPKGYIAILDDCDPDDPEWAPIGGCTRKNGLVTEDEFQALRLSPRSPTVVGHPAWRNEPSYVKVTANDFVQVINEGGRNHTFTEVANFGGGRVPPLRVGLEPAPECLAAPPSADMPPGAIRVLENLSVGNHFYQCCIHSWMHAQIKVVPTHQDLRD